MTPLQLASLARLLNQALHLNPGIAADLLEKVQTPSARAGGSGTGEELEAVRQCVQRGRPFGRESCRIILALASVSFHSCNAYRLCL